MIHTWSDLHAAIKKWFDTPVTVEDIKNKLKKKEEPPLTQTEAEKLLHTPRNLGMFDYYRDYDRFNVPDYYRDPYYRDMKRDDSIWEDQIQQEVSDALTKMQDATDPIAREQHRQDLIKKLRQKYGLDHP